MIDSSSHLIAKTIKYQNIPIEYIYEWNETIIIYVGTRITLICKQAHASCTITFDIHKINIIADV